jgi:hypothetical protein
MTNSRPFSYNTGGVLNSSIQIGNIAVSVINDKIDRGISQWWNGPDETVGYVIARQYTQGDRTGGGGVSISGVSGAGGSGIVIIRYKI